MINYNAIEITAGYDWSDSAIGLVLADYFNRNIDKNVNSKELKIDTLISIDSLFNIIYNQSMIDLCLSDRSYKFYNSTTFVINTAHTIIIVSNKQTDGYGETIETSTYIVTIYSVLDSNKLQQINDAIKDSFIEKVKTKISWFYMSNNRLDSRTICIDPPDKIYNEFYPWFTNGVDSFIDEYINSNSAILLLYGPPGTGKTTFLRHLLSKNQRNALVSYDELVLNDDRFFIDFIASEKNDTLIIEDADVMLTSRSKDKNVMMSRFLNVSEGLIKIKNKKIIFTTNISQLTNVDEALLRPGRCFSTVEFRNLTSDEARIAALSADLPMQAWTSKQSWPLSEMFNVKTKLVTANHKQHKIGFV